MAGESSYQILIAATFYLIISWIFLSIRIWMKQIHMRKRKADDYLLFVGLVCFTLLCIFQILQGTFPLGRPGTQISDSAIINILHYWWLVAIFNCISMTFIRLSIGLYLLRHTQRRFETFFVCTTLGIMLGMSFFSMLLTITQCMPVKTSWIPPSAGNREVCLIWNVVTAGNLAYGIVMAIVDWALALLPIVIFWNMPLVAGLRTYLFIVVFLGLMAGCASLLRVVFIRNPMDFIENSSLAARVAFLNPLEPCLALLASSMYYLRPLIHAVRNNFQRSHLSSSRASTIPSTLPLDEERAILAPPPLAQSPTSLESASHASTTSQLGRQTSHTNEPCTHQQTRNVFNDVQRTSPISPTTSSLPTPTTTNHVSSRWLTYAPPPTSFTSSRDPPPQEGRELSPLMPNQSAIAISPNHTSTTARNFPRVKAVRFTNSAAPSPSVKSAQAISPSPPSPAAIAAPKPSAGIRNKPLPRLPLFKRSTVVEIEGKEIGGRRAERPVRVEEEEEGFWYRPLNRCRKMACEANHPIDGSFELPGSA